MHINMQLEMEKKCSRKAAVTVEAYVSEKLLNLQGQSV